MPRPIEDVANCLLDRICVDISCASAGPSIIYGISIFVRFLALCRVVEKKDGYGGQGDEALGRKRGGLSIKIQIAIDALGDPTRILPTPGLESDVGQAEARIAGQDPGAVIADTAYDSEAPVRSIEGGGAEAVIPPKADRVVERSDDTHSSKERNKVERIINLIKQSRRVAARPEKTARNF